MDRSRLGPYEIRHKLGEGGMGEVYLADDTRLGRQVAIKVLPAEFATDPERLARFEQEARAAAALNHPHIAAIHDFGVDDGVHYMVQEYLRGRDLSEEIAAGRMSLERALELGVEIAEALGAAHAAGIVHRDLKPANIFITEQGHAKILDFGLAKLTDLKPIGSADDSKTQSPTVLGTVAGQVMGTAGYMAPEQIEGGDIDGRADIFAFGCVLYEMLAGRRPFAGRSIMQTLDLIVHEDPAPLGEVRKGTPARLQWVFDKCLAKDPKRRYQDAEDLVVDLRWIAAAPEETSHAPSGGIAAQGPSRAGIPLPAAAVAGLVLVFAAAWLGSGWREVTVGTGNPLMQLGFALPPDVSFSSIGRRAVTINRQGTVIAFSADDQIWTRQLADTVSVPLRGTEDSGRAAVFSPDGGDPEQLLAMPEGYIADGPQLLDDNRLLYTRRQQRQVWDDAEIIVQSLAGGEAQVLLSGGRAGHWIGQQFLLYARGGGVFARRWDGTDSAALGPAAPVATGVQSGREITGTAQFDVSDSGVLVYMPGDVSVARGRQILWSDRNGAKQVAPIEPIPIQELALSMDGTRVAVAKNNNTGAEIWIYDLESGAGTRLTAGGIHGRPLWSADDRWIYYAEVTIEGAFGDVSRVRADGSGTPERVLTAIGGFSYRPEALTADGRTLVLDRVRTDAYYAPDVLLYDIESAEFRVVADAEVGEYHARLEVGPPQEMFTVDISLGGSRGFSVTADGQRFLYSELPGSLATNPLEEVRVVVGWLNQLQARVPQR